MMMRDPVARLVDQCRGFFARNRGDPLRRRIAHHGEERAASRVEAAVRLAQEREPRVARERRNTLARRDRQRRALE
jgi:hypothetical protein